MSFPNAWFFALWGYMVCEFKMGKDQAGNKVITADNGKYWSIVESGGANDKTTCLRLAWLEHRRWNAFMKCKIFVKQVLTILSICAIVHIRL